MFSPPLRALARRGVGVCAGIRYNLTYGCPVGLSISTIGTKSHLKPMYSESSESRFTELDNVKGFYID